MLDQSPDLSDVLPTETNLSGPFHFFNGSFTIEFLRPDPSRNASVLARARYNSSHSEIQLGKKFAQVPPLHIHFGQTESFVVLQGRVRTTMTYDMIDNIWTREDTRTPIAISPWTPHQFWPAPSDADNESEEVDSVLLFWSHPTQSAKDFLYPPLLDHLFFISVLGHISDMHEGKGKLDVVWALYSQHHTNSANVILPTWRFLGPLRWAIPYGLQAVLATIGEWQGKSLVLEKYVGGTTFRDWQAATVKMKTS